MDLRHIPLEQLDISRLNMRHGRKKPDLDDILPSIRERGVLQPLLVRPVQDCEDRFEIVAGRRRYFASKVVAEESDDQPEPLPCAVMAAGDDAAALEASLLENIARLPADEMTQYECFARLVREGKDVDGIAETFGLTRLMVERRLALGNLIPGIKALWRDEELDRRSLQHLTMATRAQQQDWLKLHRDPEAHAPLHHNLKDWLFGGESIPARAAIFDIETCPLQIIGDLFGEDRYFADADIFWTHQLAALEEKRTALLEEGWQAVEVMEKGRYFQSWDHETCSREEGGSVFVTLARNGEVELHEGWITRTEARRRQKERNNANGGEGEGSEVRSTPETTGPLQDYLDLHRLSSVRLSILGDTGIALRLLVAHAVASSGHWQVRPEPLRSRKTSVTTSIETSPANALFETERQAVRELLGLPEGQSEVTRPDYSGSRTTVLLARLLDLDDATVLRVAAFAMAETLEAGSLAVEAAGHVLKTDVSAHWQADNTFLDLIRDKQVMQSLLADIAGPEIAAANAAEKQKVKKKIALDLVEGTNGRKKAEGWLPGWMQFPPKAVTGNGAYESAARWDRIRAEFDA